MITHDPDASAPTTVDLIDPLFERIGAASRDIYRRPQGGESPGHTAAKPTGRPGHQHNCVDRFCQRCLQTVRPIELIKMIDFVNTRGSTLALLHLRRATLGREEPSKKRIPVS